MQAKVWSPGNIEDSRRAEAKFYRQPSFDIGFVGSSASGSRSSHALWDAGLQRRFLTAVPSVNLSAAASSAAQASRRELSLQRTWKTLRKNPVDFIPPGVCVRACWLAGRVSVSVSVSDHTPTHSHSQTMTGSRERGYQIRQDEKGGAELATGPRRPGRQRWTNACQRVAGSENFRGVLAAVPGPDADWIGIPIPHARGLRPSGPLGIDSAISTGGSGTPPTWYFRLLDRGASGLGWAG